MSLVTIKGARSNRSVEVNDEGKMETTAQTEQEIVHWARSTGKAYTIFMPSTTLNSTNEHGILWIQNTDPDNWFHIQRMAVGWNGGDTNHNRHVIGAMYVSAPAYAPSAAYESAKPSSGINLSKNAPPNMNAYRWDGSAADGMTLLTYGQKAFDAVFDDGFTEIGTDGSIIMGLDSVLVFTCKASEIGVFSFLVSGFYAPAE